MERKQFLIHVTGAMGLMPLLVTQIGCDDPYGTSKDSSTSNGSTNSFTVTSSNNSGHTHNITILLADVATPPGSGKTITSTGSHTHTIMLSKSDFESLASGQTVLKTSSNSGGHTHSFSIKVP
ncbi:MAG: hypothetical protein IIB42_05460 [Candidatus Marinimicrobia bacterium]|nr:hypothetical protein [Candidatus Neomarinimicrobiota bacterium]